MSISNESPENKMALKIRKYFTNVKWIHAHSPPERNTVNMTTSRKETKLDCATSVTQLLIKPVNCPFSSAQLLVSDTIQMIECWDALCEYVTLCQPVCGADGFVMISRG